MQEISLTIFYYIDFFLGDNSQSYLPVPYLHNIELNTINLTNSAINFIHVNTFILSLIQFVSKVYKTTGFFLILQFQNNL